MKKNPRKKGKWKPKGAFDMEQLPQHLVMDILSRLPIKTLCNCRYVCKDWLHMIHGLEFARLHLQRSPISILILTSPRRPEQSRLDLIHVEKSDGSRMQVDRMRFASQYSMPYSPLSVVNLKNSCNGFICLSDCSQGGSLYVCNPVLGQYISIPSPDKDRRYLCNITAIGFSAKTNEYKVLQTSFRGYMQSDPVAKIYTIGTRVWRSIGGIPPRYGPIPFNSFLHGALHWVPYADHDYTPPHSIQSFDFEREEFRPLPLPPGSLKEYNQHDGFRLGVLKGCIFLCVFESNRSDDTHDRSLRTVDMWIMKDYGVQQSWTKILTIENLYPYSSYAPIMFLNDVEILMTRDRKSVVRYDQKTNCLQETRIIQTRSKFQSLGYCPCLVSLHDVSNGEEVKRIRDNNKLDILLGRGSSDSTCSSMPPDYKSKKLN